MKDATTGRRLKTYPLRFVADAEAASPVKRSEPLTDAANLSHLRHQEKVRAHAAKRFANVAQLPGSGPVTRQFRAFLKLENERLRVAQRLGASGQWTAIARCLTIDVLVEQVFQLSTIESAAAQESLRADRLAIVALGGYGRQELAPFSDLDILFLHSTRPPALTHKAIERCLHLLWDTGLNIGHKSYAVDECISASRGDPHFQTALVTIRLVAGSRSLFDRLALTIDREREKNPKPLLDTVRRERDERYEERSATVYLQEPNVKESAGGLRDLHSALWAAYARWGCRTLRELQDQGLIDREQNMRAQEAYNFLLRAREHTHWISGRKSDRLSLDLQPLLARKLGYTSSRHLRASEQFMRDYYRHARELHQLSEWLFARTLTRPASSKRWFARSRPERLNEQFSIRDGRLQFAGEVTTFANDPLLCFEALRHSQISGASFDPELREAIRRNLPATDRRLSTSADAARKFLELLGQPGLVGPTLRLMHEVGLLGRYLPEFGRVSLLIQHDLYHHYTVDEHTLRAIEALDDLYNSHDKNRAYLRAAFKTVEDASLLYLSLLLHDLGKGRGRGHIPRGTRIAERICDRLRLGSESKAKVVLLVKHHVLMAHVSQRRDLREPRLAADFAAQVGSLDVLNMLLLLTYADLNGVGPAVWSDWKGTLLHELYTRAREHFVGESSSLGFADQSDKLRDAVVNLLAGEVPLSKIERHFALLPDRYSRTIEAEAVAAHLILVRQLESDELACRWRGRGEFATELTICSRDRRGLFADIAGSLAANGIEILSADVNTREDGIAIDSFILREAATRRAVDTHRWSGIQRSIGASVKGEHDLGALVERWRTHHAPRRTPKPELEHRVGPHIVCDNEIAEATTVVEVRAPDETGLAYRIASELTASSLNIVCAKIATEKSDALDVFYVTDTEGAKLSEAAMRELEVTLADKLTTDY